MKRLLPLLMLPFIVGKSYAQTRDFVNEIKVRAIPIDSTLTFTEFKGFTLPNLFTELSGYKA